MNIKKLFSALSAMVVAVAMVPGLTALAATPDAELQGAYEWAHDKGVTTMSTFEAANMYGAITRAEMAKMLSVYAVESLGYKADSSKACAFSDIASVKGDLHDYIIESCQLGVMGQGITAFRPYDTISRAEFGTALSRVLWGNKYEGGNPYYANHLNALKSAGIMNQITNAESTKEVRGYVMLMLERSDEGNASSEEGTSSTDCDDAAIALACKLGSDLCPAKCKAAEDEEEIVARAGDLVVTAKASAGRKVLANGAVSDLDTLTFKTSENVEITKVTLEKYGYSTASAVINELWLEDADGNEITAHKTWSATNSKDQITLSVKKDYRNLDGSMIATIVLKTNANTGYVGGTIGFKVVSVESTAENLNLDNYTPYEYDLANYAGGNISLDNRWVNKTYNYAAGESYEIVKFKVTAGDAPVIMKQFKLVSTGAYSKVDMYDYLDDLEVLVDGSAIKARYSVDKSTKDITVSFDEIELWAKKWATFTVKATFTEDFDSYNRYVNYEISKDGFVATEKKTGARVSHDAMGPIEHLFRGGQVKFTNKSLGTIDAAKGATDVVFAEGTIEVPELINLKSFIVTGTFTTTGAYLEAMRLVIAGEEYEGTKVSTAGKTAVYRFDSVEVEKSGKVQFKLDLAKNAEWTVSFEPNSFDKAMFSGAVYDESNETVNTWDVKWYITLTKVNVKTAQATMDKKADSDDTVEYIVDEPATKVVYEGTYTTRKENVKLNKFWFTTGSAIDTTKNDVTYHVYIDGTEVGSTDQYGSESKYEEFSDILVKAGKSVSVKVEAYVSAENAYTYNNITLYLEGVDTSEDENRSGQGNAQLNEFEVKASGSVTIPTAAINTAMLKKSETVVAEFTVKPSNGGNDTKFDYIVLTGAQFSTGAFRVKIDGIEKFDPEIATGTTWTWWKYTVDEYLPSEGVTVTVTAKNAMTGQVDVKVLSINGKDFNKTYSKYFVESLVTFTSQEEGSASTVYTVNVKPYKDSYSISGFALKYGWTTCPNAVDHVPADLSVWSNEFTVYRTGTVQVICGMTYDVVDDANHVIQSVSISKNDFKDYFKVGGKEIAVPKES